MADREDVISDFAIEPEMSHAVLRDYLTRYPEHAHDLLDAFNEFQMLDLEQAGRDVSEAKIAGERYRAIMPADPKLHCAQTDDADPYTVLVEVAHCAAHWEPEARIIGNVRAIDILRACNRATSLLARYSDEWRENPEPKQ